jgi:hypothetical protein
MGRPASPQGETTMMISLNDYWQNWGYWTEHYDILYKGAKLECIPYERPVEYDRVQKQWHIFTEIASWAIDSAELPMDVPIFKITPVDSWQRPDEVIFSEREELPF